MSDGALSQDEIDALLAGVDSTSLGGGGAAPSPARSMATPAGGSEEDRKAFQDYLSGNLSAESSNLSALTGITATLKGPQVSFSNRDSLLSQLPDMVTVVKSDFSSGFPGEHIFVMPEDTARRVASLMNKEDNIEMDQMAMSVIGELVSNLVGTQITDLTKKTNNKSIAAIAPEAANVRKAAAALPAGDFLSACFQLDLGDGKNHQMWEIYGGGVTSDIARSLKGGGAPAAAPMNGMAMPGMQQGMPMQAMGMPMMGMQQGMPMQAMGMPMMGMQQGMQMMGAPANVQAVQFPNLMPHPTPQETGNIGLIMDVFMEMTVELGRTKKLIKEILNMGEGTIIELDKLAGEPVDILVNHKLIAKGEVVVIDENFGVRVTEIVSPLERMSDMG